MTTSPDFASELLSYAVHGSRSAALKDQEKYRNRVAALLEWTKGLPESAVTQLTELLLRPQTKPFDGTNDGDAGHRVAVEALGFLGNRYPAAVKAAFEQLLGHAETVGLALLGIKQWADACMLPALAALMHTRPDNVFGYLISNALCSIENHEAIALLEQLMEIYEDDPDLAEHIQEAIYCIED